ncbi:MAG: hypothetical protein FWC68_04770 [Oscillospiraceae bacterium]|nr:hypothetical protein [Oscillospiraceae bacterium]
MNILLGYITTFSYIVFVILMASFLQKKGLLSQEGERKTVHILMGFCVIPIYFFLFGNINFVIIPLLFVFINALLKHKGPLVGWNRDEENDTHGTVFYAISVFLMSVVTLIHENFLMPYLVGVFCMAFADGLAGFFRKKNKNHNI